MNYSHVTWLQALNFLLISMEITINEINSIIYFNYAGLFIKKDSLCNILHELKLHFYLIWNIIYIICSHIIILINVFKNYENTLKISSLKTRIQRHNKFFLIYSFFQLFSIVLLLNILLDLVNRVTLKQLMEFSRNILKLWETMFFWSISIILCFIYTYLKPWIRGIVFLWET